MKLKESVKTIKLNDIVSLYDIKGLWIITEIWQAPESNFVHYKVSARRRKDKWVTITEICRGEMK